MDELALQKVIKDAIEAVDLCKDIYSYCTGKGKYDFSHLSVYDRENAAFDAWLPLEERLRILEENQ